MKMGRRLSLVRERIILKQQIADAQARLKKIDAEIIEILDGREEAVIDKHLVKYKTIARDAYMVAATTFGMLTVKHLDKVLLDKMQPIKA
jgi:hypothetical protein